MHRKALLIVTALGEGSTGAALVAAPAVVLALLLGVESAAPEALVVGRVAGGALVGIAVICWAARSDGGHRPTAVLLGVLTYDVAAAILLAHAGAVLGMTGIMLWPAIGLHAGLAVWCVACLLHNASDRDRTLP